MTLVAGVTSISSSTLAVGTHPLAAVYSGDANFLSVSSPVVSEQINPITPTLNWTPAPGFVYGANLSALLNAAG